MTTKIVVQLPVSAWGIIAANSLSAVGAGMTVPFLMVYLVSERGLDVASAGLAAACFGLIGIVGNPLGGLLADRWGERRTVVLGLLIAAAAALLWTSVGSVPEAIGTSLLSGFGTSIHVPAQAALLGRLVGSGSRSTVFAVANAGLNAGVGVGGVVGTVVVTAAEPDPFPTLYVIDAISYLVAIAIVWSFSQAALDGRTTSAPARTASSSSGPRLTRDRALMSVWALSALLSIAGIGQFAVVFPMLATGFATLDPGLLGVLFAVNTASVACCQLVSLRLFRGWKRTTAAAMIGPVWAASWGLVFAAGTVHDGTAVIVLLALASALFAFGETLVWPTLPAIVNDIAPDHLRGRYNGAFQLAMTMGIVLGPVLGGNALASGHGGALLIGSITLCALAGPAAAGLRLLVPSRANPPIGARD